MECCTDASIRHTGTDNKCFAMMCSATPLKGSECFRRRIWGCKQKQQRRRVTHERVCALKLQCFVRAITNSVTAAMYVPLEKRIYNLGVRHIFAYINHIGSGCIHLQIERMPRPISFYRFAGIKPSSPSTAAASPPECWMPNWENSDDNDALSVHTWRTKYTNKRWIFCWKWNRCRFDAE